MRAYLYARRRVIAAFLLFAAVFGVVFWLGGVPMGAVGYASAICGVLALAFGCADFPAEVRRAEKAPGRNNRIRR